MTTPKPTLCACVFLLLPLGLVACDRGAAGDVIVLADFEEEGSWGEGWLASGDAFLGPDGAALKPPQNGWEGRVGGLFGTSSVDTFVRDPEAGLELGDAATGRLESPDFIIERRFLNLAIDGGSATALSGVPTHLEVYVDDQLFAFFTGDADFPVQVRPFALDLEGLEGRRLRLRIEDENQGGFGWFVADQITLSDTAGAQPLLPLATFDDPVAMVADGWRATGALEGPTGPNAWEGITRQHSDGMPRRIGSRGFSTCRLDGPDGPCNTPMGTLTSPPFVAEGGFLTFAVAGGIGLGGVGIELVDDAEATVRSFSPSTGRPELNSDAAFRHFDLAGLEGRSLRVRIFDRSPNASLTVDEVQLSAVARGALAETVLRSADDRVNVTTAPDAFDNVVASFDDPQGMLSDGWQARGAFASPENPLAWSGTTLTEASAARVGIAAISTCQIGGGDCDGPTGDLLSPPFTVTAPALSFLMSGGNGTAAVGLELINEEGATVARYQPSSCAPSVIDSDDDWSHIDLGAFMGATLRLRIFDDDPGGCGFVSADHFYLSTMGRGRTVATAAPPTPGPDATNVTLSMDAFDQVLGSFDVPAESLARGWQASGDFESPASADAWSGTARSSEPLAARVGARAVSTCELAGGGCDEPTGTLVSPPFTVDAPRLTFLMAGGDGTAEVGLELLDASGQVFWRYRPAACSPSFIDGDDDWHQVDLSDRMGEVIALRIFDEATGGCGFVSFDHFYLSRSGRGDLVGMAVQTTPVAVNVTTSGDAFDRVVGSFDDPPSMVTMGWETTGAFTMPQDADSWSGTARPSEPTAARVGARAVSTCEIGGGGCDAPVGSLTSPEFEVIAPQLSLLISGGNGTADVGLEVIGSDGALLAAYRPNACTPSFIDGDDDWVHLDLSAVAGQRVRLRFFDRSAGSCGFLSFDHAYLSGSGRGPRVATAVPATKVTLSADALRSGAITSFEMPTRMIADGWVGTGAFANPSDDDAWSGTARASNPDSGRVGERAVSTCEIGGGGCDGPTGTLTSPLVRVERPVLNFLMAGGGAAAQVGIEVLDATDTVIASYSPKSCAPSFVDGDDDWRFIDLTAAMGTEVRLRFYDREAGGCGFIGFDHVYFGDEIRGSRLAPSVSGIVVGDFDDAPQTLAAGWTATGAFASPSTPDAWTGTSRLANVDATRVGLRAVSTCEIGGGGCDGPTGTLRSPPFVVSERYLNFLMTGGNGMAPVGLRVLDERGVEMASYTPNGCGPSFVDGADDWHHIDLQALAGTTIQVEIFDESSGGCGFLSFDHVFLSAMPEGTP